MARAHLAPLVSDGAVPSLAWAVVRDQDTAVGGFGGAAPETSFQIGSVTKVFTALLLADMAERARFTCPIRPRATFRARRSRDW